MPQPLITKIHLKIAYLKFRSNFPGANELRYIYNFPHINPITAKLCTFQDRLLIPVMLPWIFLRAQLTLNGAPGNIQGNLTGTVVLGRVVFYKIQCFFCFFIHLDAVGGMGTWGPGTVACFTKVWVACKIFFENILICTFRFGNYIPIKFFTCACIKVCVDET